MGVKQRSKSLSAKKSQLSDTFYQLDVISNSSIAFSDVISFQKRISDAGYPNGIKPGKIEIFQLNIGKLCNQTCAHCHVDAGPDKKEENMNRKTLEQCLDIVVKNNIKTVDITGGAPEMNPHFRWFVESCTNAGIKVMVRCNLTIIMANKKYYDLPKFFAKNNVHVISSLPYFTKTRTDSQRGDGVFNDSIEALKLLNEVGYGMENSELILDLVYNPSGAFLPGDQVALENEFKRQLQRRFGITFNNLYVITNLPVSRFLDYLIETENYESYMTELSNAFNPSTLEGLMCRSTISVSWDGYIYDCDFNQMLDLKSDIKQNHISNFNVNALNDRTIVINQHCYGCTAGSGSSCGGEIV
ncbi:MAG: radical SAM/Cys-rich domain protein [Saprospiraceae bacterium]|nr:radical SAM/Cys-rich domain protein [Saprospiraceae bacterium]